ncbi:hypothetical protein AGMMS50256_20340 [Betaproteobacteria bacterium]|nr:hypothetical protein AGMMS50256_20340 [Betaproteobacteria bacterium]
MVHLNKLKKAIACRACIKGVHFTYSVPPVLEIVSNLGIDFIYIDGEHGLFDLHEVESLCILAECYGMTPIARVRANTSDVITQYLDCGVKGIVVPHVDNTADARRAVDACFYPTARREIVRWRAALCAFLHERFSATSRRMQCQCFAWADDRKHQWA